MNAQNILPKSSQAGKSHHHHHHQNHEAFSNKIPNYNFLQGYLQPVHKHVLTNLVSFRFQGMPVSGTEKGILFFLILFSFLFFFEGGGGKGGQEYYL